MSDVPTNPERDPEAPGPWNVRVNDATGEGYRPAELIIAAADLDRLVAALPEGIEIDPEVGVIDFSVLTPVLEKAPPPNPLVVKLVGPYADDVDAFLRAGVAGEIVDDNGVAISIEHNTVFINDACQCIECPPHPAVTSGHALQSNPVWASPVWASPVWASPVWASPVWASGRTSNTALPANRAVTPRPLESNCGDGEHPPTVIILDTGLADLEIPENAPFLPRAMVTTPDAPDRSDANGDGVLDPVAGHGTFIAGLVELATRGTRIIVRKIMGFRGDTDVATFLNSALGELAGMIDNDLEASRKRLKRVVIGMSFSGRMSPQDVEVTRTGLTLFGQLGIVVVASAGNDATCERMYPAGIGDPTDPLGLANVVSVGALSRCGPAGFSNYGPWVRACAAGDMLTSSFFAYVEPLGDFREFNGYAQWSGTSFSVGVVIGALTREMRMTGSPALDAVRRLVDAQGLPSIPNLGTIVT